MLVLGRRCRGRITARTLVYCGWGISTMTILVVFITALNGYQDDVAASSWKAFESEAIRPEMVVGYNDGGVEAPNRRSLSAKDPESETALEILRRRDGRVHRQKSEGQVRRDRRSEIEMDMLSGGVRNEEYSSIFSNGVAASKMDGERGDSTKDGLSERRTQRSGAWKTRKRPSPSKQVKAARRSLDVPTQLARPEGGSRKAKVGVVHLSSTEWDSQISGGDPRPEDDAPSAMGAGDGNPMKGERLPVTQIQTPIIDADVAESRVSARSADGVPVVVDGVFWSQDVEQLVPEGITDDSVSEFRDALSRLSVRSMRDPQWNRCGRPKNQFVVLEDGTPLCARYRSPQETLIRGEILSFHLSRLIGLDNVPAVVLSQLNATDPLWRTQNLTAAQWTTGTYVALIQWMQDLNHEKSRVRMPRVLLSSYESATPMTAGSLDRHRLTTVELTSLVQWTDLILFDYITGHYDRVASMQDGAEREMRPSIMSESIRNLRQIRGKAKLVFLDNESGLIDGYELMYHGAQTGLQFLGFHQRLLKATCVFRRKTVARIRWLATRPLPERVLEEYVDSREPLYRKLKETPEVALFRTYFGVRLKEVVEWIDHCESLMPK